MARSPGGSGRGPRDRDAIATASEENELKDKLVTINRVAKVVKGGRRFGFAALVVVGDQQGRVGHGAGKAREVPEAIRKATEAGQAQHGPRAAARGPTLHHDVIGRFGAGRVVVRAAPAGTGIIAGGPMRAVFETLGMKDIVAKSIGSTNPHNMIKATFAALNRCTRRAGRGRRSKKVGDLLGPPRGRPRRRQPREDAMADGKKTSHPDRQPDRPHASSGRRWSASVSTSGTARASWRIRPRCAA